MFGNRLGWGISTIILAASVFLAYQLYLAGQPTPPSGWVQQTVRPLTLAGTASTLLPPRPDVAHDAGELYRQAIADYEAHRDAYEKMQHAKEVDHAAIDALHGLDCLVQASRCSGMSLFAHDPSEVINYNSTVPALEALDGLGRTMSNLTALAAYDKDYDTAKRYATALFVLGFNLYQERIVYDELERAETMMGNGAAALQQIAEKQGDNAALATLKSFQTARLDEVKNTILPVWAVLSGQGDANLAAHAGDMFQLAMSPTADHPWRVEAIRRLGRVQLNATSAADNVQAKKIVTQLAADPTASPEVQAAAKAARDITSYENQSQR